MQADEVKVSVVIPVYNSGKVLERTVDSVLGQTFKEFELILVDDGSTDDDTLAAINTACARDTRVKAYFNKHLGVSGARDFGVSNAHGKYVYCMDQDDFVHPNLLEYCVRTCEARDLELLTFRWKNVDGNGLIEFDPIPDQTEAFLHLIDQNAIDMVEFELALKLLHVDPWSQFVRKSLMVKYPYSNTGYMYHILLLADKARYWGVTELKLYYYNIANPNSMMHSQQVTNADFMTLWYMDLAKIYDMYALKDQKILNSVCKIHIEAGIKSLFHLIKRHGGTGWDVFADMVEDFIFHRRIPISILGVKRVAEYLVIILWRKTLGVFKFKHRGGNNGA